MQGFESNVRGTWTLLQACLDKGVERVVFASSDKAYGAHETLPYREDFPLQPTAPYEASKAAADLIARSYWHSYGLPVAVTRFANIYGGGDLNFSRLIPEAVSAALDGRAPVLRSDGSPERDFLYVEDAASAYLAIAGGLDRDDVRGEAFNAGGGRSYPVLEVIETIARLAGTGVEPDIRGTGNPDGEIDKQYVDPTKLRETLGWEPEVGLEEGLERTIEWYRDHPESWAPRARRLSGELALARGELALRRSPRRGRGAPRSPARGTRAASGGRRSARRRGRRSGGGPGRSSRRGRRA